MDIHPFCVATIFTGKRSVEIEFPSDVIAKTDKKQEGNPGQSNQHKDHQKRIEDDHNRERLTMSLRIEREFGLGCFITEMFIRILNCFSGTMTCITTSYP